MSYLQGMMYEMLTRLVVLDWFGKVTTTINKFTGKLQPMLIVIAILCAVGAGALWMMGEDMKRSAKSWLIGIMIGVFIISSATALINTYVQTMSF